MKNFENMILSPRSRCDVFSGGVVRRLSGRGRLFDWRYFRPGARVLKSVDHYALAVVQSRFNHDHPICARSDFHRPAFDFVRVVHQQHVLAALVRADRAF